MATFLTDLFFLLSDVNSMGINLSYCPKAVLPFRSAAN
jgi:hypothetical protein